MGNLSTKLATERSKCAKRPVVCADDHPTIKLKKPKISESQLRLQALELIDINDHCLWHMFEFLDVNDLVHISEVHERFVSVAISVYRRLYRKSNKLVLNLGSVHYQSNDDCCPCPASENIEPFFRHFGHLVSNAFINCMGKRKADSYDIGALLQKFCADSLVQLDLALCDENDFPTIQTPFTKLQKLTFIEAKLNRNVSQMDVWFPHIQSLELINVKLSQPESFEVNFPHLKSLEIYIEESNLPIQTVSEMLRHNPQLKSLSLLCDYDQNFIESLSRNVPGLEELELWAPEDRFLSFQNHKIHFAAVKKFTLNSCTTRGDFLVNIPFAFSGLREIKFDGFNQFKGQILDFINRSPTLKKLQLIPYVDDWDDLTHGDVQKLLGCLPKLTELEFCADSFVVDDVVQLLNCSEQLTDVVLLFMEMPFCEHFQDSIQMQWNLTKQAVEKYNAMGDLTYIQFCLKRKHSN